MRGMAVRVAERSVLAESLAVLQDGVSSAVVVEVVVMVMTVWKVLRAERLVVIVDIL